MSDPARKSNHAPPPGEIWQLPAELIEIAREAGAEIVWELLGVFQNDSVCRLDALRGAIQRGEASRIRAEAHSLKGSASQVGATAMSELCRKMEQLPQDRRQSDQIALLEEIELSFARFREQLSESTLQGLLASEEIQK